jgi:predicted nucleic acid-binding protein
MAAKIVVDSSVLIKWVKTKDEDLVNEARRLLADIESVLSRAAMFGHYSLIRYS